MNRGLGLALLASMALWTSSAVAGPPAALKQAADLSDAGHCDKALPLIRQALADPGLAKAPAHEAMAAWDLGAHCALDQGDHEEAFADAVKATSYDNAFARSWQIRLELGLYLKRVDDAVDTATFLARAAPRLVNSLSLHSLLNFHHHLTTSADRTQQQRFLAALDQANYQPPAPFDQADGLWLEYAGMLADEGSTASASRVLTKVQSPWAVLQARLDNRFAVEVASAPDAFDPRKATERQLEKNRATMAAHPDLAEGVVDIAQDLRMLGRAREALDLLDAALAKQAAAPPAGKPAYSDLDRQANWLVDERARALRALGMFDEHIETLRKGAGLKEGGADNVSQMINLANALNDVGRPKEALDVLAPFGERGEKRQTSPYGKMVLMSVRACALAQLGQTAEQTAALAYLHDHEKDDPSGVTDALICANDLDGAAASFIQRLEAPDDRPRALLALSDFADKPQPPPWAKETDRRLALVRARPDVQAAIAKVGHIEVFPLAGDPD